MKQLRTAVGLVLLLAALALGLAAGPARAAELTKAGWWWRVNDPTPLGTLPPAPTVPEGALMVGGAPDGATAIAALHFELDAGEGAPVLTLNVADNGDQGGERAVLAACLTGSAWQPATSGAWTTKPFPACDQGSVTGVRSSDGAQWTFALAPLLSDGIVDVMLVPGLDPALPAGLNGSTFQLVFAAPTSASLVTTGGTGATPGIDLAGGGPQLPEVGGFSPPLSGGDLSLPPVAPAGAFTPSLPTADQGLTATAPVVERRNRPLPTPVAAVEDHRVLGLVVLALCGAALLWSAQMPVLALRRLGGFDQPGSGPGDGARGPDGTTHRGGVGRFARDRTGSVPHL
jgi:hypothetical protein